jgi:hypothetical protein
MSTGEFHVDGGIPCQRGNSVLTGEFRVNGGIPCGHPTVHLVEKNFKRVFTINIDVLSFFQKCVSGLADFCDL